MGNEAGEQQLAWNFDGEAPHPPLQLLPPIEDNPEQSDSKNPSRIRRLGRIGLRGLLPVAAIAGAALAVSPALRHQVGLDKVNRVDPIAAIEHFISPEHPHINRPGPASVEWNYLEANYAKGDGLYVETPGSYFDASIYSHTVALNALYVMALTPGSDSDQYNIKFQQTLGALNSYWGGSKFHLPDDYFALPPPKVLKGFWGRFNDDVEWAARGHQYDFNLNHNFASFSRSVDIFNKVTSQWDPHSGGIPWKEQLPGETNTDRALVSNAPAVILGISLYKTASQPGMRQFISENQRQQWLGKSEQIYDWVSGTLFDPQTGLYFDRIGPKGVKQDIYTYAQGLMANAEGQLSLYNPEKYSMEDAVALAERSMQYFSSHKYYYGRVDIDAEYFRNLFHLAGQYKSPGFTSLVRASLAEALAHDTRLPLTHLEHIAGLTELKALASLPESKYSQL